MSKAKRPPVQTHAKPARNRRGKTGATGATGPAGPPGEPGKNHTADIAALAREVTEVVSVLTNHATKINQQAAEVAALAKDLHTQLIRIAQIQAQLDHLTGGQGPIPTDRRRVPRTES